MRRMFYRGVIQRASTSFGAVTVAARRRVCDSAKPLAAQVHQALAQVKAIEMKLDHLEKDEVTDLLLGFVKRGEIAPDQVLARLPEFRMEPTLDRQTMISADGLRFAKGQIVECRMGVDEWARGKVVDLLYREDDWPEWQVAPYQVLLEGDPDGLTARTIWAPADTDDCIRVAVRFAVGAAVECLLGRDKASGKDQWVRGKVDAHYHRDPSAPASLLAPYRVLLDRPFTADTDTYVWAPLDADECIRAP